MKAILLALAAVVGSVLSVLVYLAVDFHIHPTFAADELGVWTEYGSLIFGGVGTIPGVVMGRGAYAWINKRLTPVPEPGEYPAADATVQPRRNIRPLTWLYRA